MEDKNKTQNNIPKKITVIGAQVCNKNEDCEEVIEEPQQQIVPQIKKVSVPKKITKKLETELQVNDDVNTDVDVDNSNFFPLFGLLLPKQTLYLMIVVVLIAFAIWYFSESKNKKNDDKKKKDDDENE